MDYWSYYEYLGSDPFQTGGVYERLKSNVPQIKPDASDLLMTEALENFLSEEPEVHETAEGERIREKTLADLEALCLEWVRGVCRLKNYNETVVQAATIKVYTFGSYRLGIHGAGTDIDALIVGPNYATREGDFFGTEEHSLEQKLKNHEDVSEVISVPEAIVPVIKIKFGCIAFDLVYVPLASEHVSSNLDINDISIIRNVSQDSVTSINGRRVTDKILQIVPDVHVFRVALRFLKVWAKRRGIYGNVLGYLGGINWALMLAFVQTVFPLSNPSMLILKFFKIFSQWQWPTPILLEGLQYESIGLPIWDPRANPSERSQVMPIITPVYPAFNSSYSVQENTLEIIIQEFVEAQETCSQIFKKGQEKAVYTDGWRKLTQAFPFFETYPNFLKVVCTAGNSTDLLEWTGWVQSRIRRLVNSLSNAAEVRLWPHEYKPDDEEEPHQVWFWIGVKKPHFLSNKQRNGSPLVDMGHPIKEFRYQVFHHYLHLKEGMSMQVNECKPYLIPDSLFPNGKNPYKETRNSDSEPTTPTQNQSTSTTFTLPQQQQIPQQEESTNVASIPGLELTKESALVSKVDCASETCSLSAIVNCNHNERKRKLDSSPAKTEEHGDSASMNDHVKSQRLRPTIVPVHDDLTNYLGDEGILDSERDIKVSRGNLKIKWAQK